MTDQERDYEAVLSRVLHTTTDQLEPVGDGLTKIRARLGEPWLIRQWWLLRSEFVMLRWLVVVRCEAFFSTVKSAKPGSAAADSAVDPLAPLIACSAPETQKHAGRPRALLGGITAWIASSGITAWIASKVPGRRQQDGPRSSGPVMNWLRPALAVAGAVVLVVGGVFALGNVQQGLGFIGLGDSSHSPPGSSSQVGANGSPNGGGSADTGRRPGSTGQGHSSSAKAGAGTAHNKAGSSPSPCTSPSVQPNSPSPAPSPTSPSPSPSPTQTSPSPSPTPTSPSPSTSTSDGPLTGANPGNTQEAIGTTALVCGQPRASASPSPA